MVQKGFAGRRQLNAVSATNHQLNADFPFEISDLPAERWLGRVELLLGGNSQTSCIGHGGEVAKMPELHPGLPYLAGMGPSRQSLFRPAQNVLYEHMPTHWATAQMTHCRRRWNGS